MAAKPPLIRVYLFGPVILEWAGQPLYIPRRRVRALLYRLAVHLQDVPREHLAFLFWPDEPNSVARRNLSHLLTHLRRALPDPRLLQTTADHVCLNPQYAWSDTATFERLCAPGAEQPWLEALQQAVDLYRGSLLTGFSLPGCAEFEGWLLLEQRYLERRYLEALVALSDGEAARGDYGKAIACAQRYLEVNELAEEIHRRLVALYAAAGDRRAALGQFEHCTVVLERELGVEPLPETRAIYQAVLEGKLPPPQPRISPSKKPALPSFKVPLAGRDEAQVRLGQLFAEVQAGKGQFVFVSGEAGVGKSRLVQDFVSGLESPAIVLAGSAYPGEHRLPYQPLADALRTTLERHKREGEASPPFPSNCSPVWLAEMTRLLPELLDWCPGLSVPPAGEPGENRARLFEALSRFILGMSADAVAVVLSLDNLQWADGATLEWLAYFSHRLRDRPVMVIGAFRSDEAESINELRNSLLPICLLTEITLGGLDAASVLQILHHYAVPVAGDEIFAERLRRVTGGNPFFILEILSALSEASQLPGDPRRLEAFPLPDTVRQVLDTRLRRLTPSARQVLEAAAVLGARFHFDWVYPVSARAEIETVDGLDELVTRQLLVEEATGYRFVHALVRQAVETGLGPMRRVLLHRRAAHALERLTPDAAVDLARHFEAGGEMEKAFHYHDLAARQAETACAWKEAEKHYTRALELMDSLDLGWKQPDVLARRGCILTARAHLRFLQANLEGRDADLSTLTALTGVSGDQHLRLQVLMHRTRYMNLDARYEEAIAVADEGLALADLLNERRAGCRLLAQIGFAHYFLGQPQPALAALEVALARAREEPDPEMRGRIVHILGYVYFHMADYAQAMVCQQEALACHQTVGDYNRMAWDGIDIGAIYLEMGCFAEAEEHLNRYLALARQIGARPVEAYSLYTIGLWELYQGRFSAAIDCLGQAFDIQREFRGEHTTSAIEDGLGLAFYHLGDFAEARRWLEEALRRARQIRHRRRTAYSLVGLGLVETAAGDLLAAQGCLAEATAIARESLCWLGLATGLAALARLEREAGHPPRALEHACEAVRIAQEKVLPTCEMWGEMEAGLALLAQDESPAALEHTQRSVALAPRAHQGWVGIEEVYRAHAQVLQRLGRVETAAEYTCRAQEMVAAKASRIPNPELRQRYLHTRRDG